MEDHPQAEMHLETHRIHLPKGTGWPLGLAFGVTCLFAGLVTNYIISGVGAVLILAGIWGWFRQVLPHEQVEHFEVSTEVIPVQTARPEVARVEGDERHRAALPLETYPFLSGIKGGFVGGTVMILLAELYSVVKYHSIWYVVNLLGGAGVGVWTNPTDQQIARFHLTAFVIAVIIHTAASFMVGLLYGALLPIMPRHPIILGGLIAPALWTGMLHSILGLVNPFFDERINWWWFALSQVGFGLTAGYVVARTGRLKRLQDVPLAIRLGVETPGAMHGHGPQGGGA